jgi:hypothetical protein
MSAETLADPAVRAGLHRRLGRRNRIIGVLRVLVPLAGLLLLAFLVAQIVIANIAKEYGVTGIRFERDRLLIDDPRYEGVTEGGTRYKVVARTASAQMANANVIELGDATLYIERPDGVSFTATAAHAFYDLVGQTVEVPDLAEVVDSRQTTARLQNTFVDWRVQTITARSGAVISFADGTKLTANSLVMYGDENRWDMTGVVLDTPGQQEEEEQ